MAMSEEWSYKLRSEALYPKLLLRDMAQETNQSQAPLLCTTGCGFYSNPRNNGMCSVCYKDFLQRQNNNGRVSPPVTSSAVAVSSLGESLLTQYTDSSTVDVPSATALKDKATTCVVSSTTALTPASHSDGESTATSGARLETDEIRASVSEDSDQASVDGQDKSSDSNKPTVLKKNRCFACRKKLGLTGFDCRCGNVFCGMHRYSDIHNCTFDYKADAAEKIRKANPVVVGEKIQKI